MLRRALLRHLYDSAADLQRTQRLGILPGIGTCVDLE
jgi:hypothetical protein